MTRVDDRCHHAQQRTRLCQLHTDHAEAVLHFLLSLTHGERHTAEDLLQETMLRAWRHLDSVPMEHDEQRRWLLTVARNLLIDVVRVRRRRPTEVSLLESRVPPRGDETTDTVLAGDNIRNAFIRLTVDHQVVLRELYIRGRSMAETADHLRVPLGTVKSRAHYALVALRAMINGTD